MLTEICGRLADQNRAREATDGVLSLRDIIKNRPSFDGTKPADFFPWVRGMTQDVLAPGASDAQKVGVILAKLSGIARVQAQDIYEQMGLDFAAANKEEDDALETREFHTPMKRKPIRVKQAAPEFVPDYRTFLTRLTTCIVGNAASTERERVLSSLKMGPSADLRAHTNGWIALYDDFVAAGGEMLERQKTKCYLRSLAPHIITDLRPVPNKFLEAVRQAQDVFDDLRDKADLQRPSDETTRAVTRILAAIDPPSNNRQTEQLLAAVSAVGLLPDSMRVVSKSEREISRTWSLPTEGTEADRRDALDASANLARHINKMSRSAKPVADDADDSDDDSRTPKRRKAETGRDLHAVQVATNDLAGELAAFRRAYDNDRRVAADQSNTRLVAQLENTRSELDKARREVSNFRVARPEPGRGPPRPGCFSCA
jgi:hypothetical protein